MDKATPKVPGSVPDGSTEHPISKQRQLMLLHHRLMAVYVYAIQGVQEGHRPRWRRRLLAGIQSVSGREADEQARGFRRLMVRSRRDDETSRPYKRGPITRALVDSHVKAKLRELQAAYAQIEQSVPDTKSTHSFREWLRTTQESLARFSSTLTIMIFARRIMTALWPLVIALIAVLPIWSALFSVLGKESAKPKVLLVLQPDFVTWCHGGVDAERPPLDDHGL
jgi:hypothetical protein